MNVMDVQMDETKQLKIDLTEIEMGDSSEDLSPESHDALLEYLLARLLSNGNKRPARLQRYARIDQAVNGWQKLSPEDSIRDSREEMTGRSQALPMNVTISKSHVDDAVAFFSEVFAPLGGNFFATPGKKDQTGMIQNLTKKMDQDMKMNAYYDNVVSAMTSLAKYNIGGFHLYWNDDRKHGDNIGNVCEAIDVYNLLYDSTVRDVSKLHRDGEWVALVKERNRLWLLKQANQGGLINLEKIVGPEKDKDRGSNSFVPGKAKFYKHPPNQTRMRDDGKDTKSSLREGGDVDWDGFGLALGDDQMAEIDGHEIIKMYCWIIPSQFDIEVDGEAEGAANKLALWQFTICDSKAIIYAAPIENAEELPVYLARLDKDDMGEAARTLAENLMPFQRIVSFLMNTAIEGIRSNIWGFKGYDPAMFDITKVQNGETSGFLKSKVPGRDVRTGLLKLDGSSGTEENFKHAGVVLDLMRSLFPSQAMPSQIAGMDRAVNSQVSAVLQGAMRKMHMLVRRLDSALMLPVRIAQWRNISRFDPEKEQFKSLTAEQVAEVLASGLGQVNREAAAEQIRTLIFALIQNPDGNQGIDTRGLFQLWSILMNLGTDLSEFIQQMTPEQLAGAQGGAPNPDPNAATQPGAASVPTEGVGAQRSPV